ncbi:MAG: hypothetical protein SFW36_22480 [Leptolyngbyaceae cyanobacterium bins.59]|nr:hypothetical protein [Leptolyngbyaceae cyanobacterium bins.59]
MPQPLKGASQQTRNGMNQALYSVFPSWRPKTRPYERTERAIEQEGKQEQRK